MNVPPDTKTYLGREGEHKAFAFLRQPQRTGMAAVLASQYVHLVGDSFSCARTIKPALQQACLHAGANEVFLFSLGEGPRSMVGTDHEIEREHRERPVWKLKEWNAFCSVQGQRTLHLTFCITRDGDRPR